MGFLLRYKAEKNLGPCYSPAAAVRHIQPCAFWFCYPPSEPLLGAYLSFVSLVSLPDGVRAQVSGEGRRPSQRPHAMLSANASFTSAAFAGAGMRSARFLPSRILKL